MTAIELRNKRAKRYSAKCKAKRIGRFIIVTSIIATLVGCGYKLHTTAATPKAKEYGLTTVVVGVYPSYIEVEDFNGNVWSLDGSTEDWFVGDIASLIMTDNGTDIIYDDEIVSARYSGWFEEWARRYPEGSPLYADCCNVTTK